jgi:hypothetical protein
MIGKSIQPDYSYCFKNNIKFALIMKKNIS